MILDDLPEDNTEEEAVRRFRLLRTAVFKVLPDDCLLKPSNVLTGAMVDLLDTEIIDNGFANNKDICALCLRRECPHFDVEDKANRILKLVMLRELDRKK